MPRTRRWVGALAVLAAVTLIAQAALTNDDLIKLAKSGLSEEFILNLIEKQPVNLYTDAGRLADLKAGGVSERVISAAVKRSPPQEPLTTDGLLKLAGAGFSEQFLIGMLEGRPVAVATDADNIVRLKQAGISERVLAALVAKGSGKEVPAGTVIYVRMIDAIDSDKNAAGETFRASLDEPLTVDGEEIAPKGADAVVRLAAAQESGKLTGKTELTIELVSVTVGGKPVAFRTSAVSQESDSQGVRTAKTAAAVGAVGAIIGAIAGGGKGAAIGAGAGAAAGAGSQVFLGGQRVRIPSEVVLGFTTQAAVKTP